jgi:ArsR family transcriptional regulator
MKSKVKILKALSDENRLKIALMLNVRALCVCEIKAALDIAVSTISSHLKILNNAGVVDFEKDGRWIIYSLDRNNAFACTLLDEIIKDEIELYEDIKNNVVELTREQCSTNP